jgi:hypothetical protein
MDLVHRFNNTATTCLVRAEKLEIQRRYHRLLSIMKVFTVCEQLLLLRLQSDVDDDDVIQMYLPPHYLDGL